MAASKRRKTSADGLSVTSATSPDAAGPKTVHAKMDKRRFDCMMNQRRYRERKKSKTQHTEWYVDELQRETRRLEDHVALLHSNVLMQHVQAGAHRCRAVTNYLALFRTGLARAPGPARDAQIAHLDALMDADVVFNGAVGKHMVAQQWAAFNEYFSALALDVVDVHAVGDDQALVIVEAVIDLTFSHHTLSCLFPHVAARADLAAKLVGATVRCPVRLSFAFAGPRVAATEADVDFVAGVHACVGSLADTAAVVHGGDARLTAQGLIAPEALLTSAIVGGDPIRVDMHKSPQPRPLKTDVHYILVE